jgi:hypothetical protein
VPYPRSFVPNWCGCEKKLALRALGWLDRNHFIWRGGTIDVGKPKPMALWAFAEEDGA